MKLGCGLSKVLKFVGLGPRPKTPKRNSFVSIPAPFSFVLRREDSSHLRLFDG